MAAKHGATSRWAGQAWTTVANLGDVFLNAVWETPTGLAWVGGDTGTMSLVHPTGTTTTSRSPR